MKKSNELLFNTIIIGIGKLGTKVITFFLLPLYTSILTTSEYGTYDLLLTISMFLVPLITLLMEESMFRFLIDCKSDKEKKEIISLSSIYILLSLIIFLIIYILIGQFINIPYMWFFLGYIIVAVLNSLKNALVRGMGKIKIYSLSNFISSILTIILNIFFIAYLKIGVKGLLLSYIIANICTTIFILLKLKIYNYISFNGFNKTKLTEMIKYSIPLVPNSISWTIINLSDRIIISGFMGTDYNGIYSVSNKFPSVMDTIYGFFYTAWKESAAKSLNENESDANNFYNKVYVTVKDFMWAIVVGIICILPLTFNILVKNDFINAYVYIPILILAIYFSNISGFYGGIFSAYKETKVMGTSTVVGAIINLVINILLIKYIGLWAATISTLISALITYIYRKNKVKKYIIFNESKSKQILSIISLILALIGFYIPNITISILILFIITMYCVIINKSTIKQLVNILIKKAK